MQKLAISTCKRVALAVALCAVVVAAQAGEHPGQCSVPLIQENFFGKREETITSMKEMTEGCLKALMLQCGDVASRELLAPADAAMCSMGYEALLRKSFGGSFQAMMAWWRVEHEARTFAP